MEEARWVLNVLYDALAGQVKQLQPGTAAVQIPPGNAVHVMLGPPSAVAHLMLCKPFARCTPQVQ